MVFTILGDSYSNNINVYYFQYFHFSSFEALLAYVREQVIVCILNILFEILSICNINITSLH